MGKSPEREPEIVFGAVKELPEKGAAVAHIISNSLPLIVKMAEDIADRVGAEVVVMEKTSPPNQSSNRSFGLSGLRWGNCEWQPSGSAWISPKPGHA